MSAPQQAARVEDLAYTRYEGVRRGRAAAIWSLARWSALSALGARKSWRAKLIPIVLTAIAFAPALIVLGLRAIIGNRIGRDIGDSLIPYRGYYTFIGLDILLFAGIVTPEMLCPDRLDNVLSLYFSTAVDRAEYVVGKLAAAILPLLGVTLLPVLTLFAGNVLFADDAGTYFGDHVADVPRIVASGLLVALFYAVLGLAIASLTRRRAVAMGAYIGLLIAGTAIANPLYYSLHADSHVLLLDIGNLPLAASRALFSSPNGRGSDVLAWGWWWAASAAVIVASLAVLAWRYREGSDE